jgi:hypothetical protein
MLQPPKKTRCNDCVQRSSSGKTYRYASQGAECDYSMQNDWPSRPSFPLVTPDSLWFLLHVEREKDLKETRRCQQYTLATYQVPDVVMHRNTFSIWSMQVSFVRDIHRTTCIQWPLMTGPSIIDKKHVRCTFERAGHHEIRCPSF